jgi:hypothetical protein
MRALARKSVNHSSLLNDIDRIRCVIQNISTYDTNSGDWLLCLLQHRS